MKDVLLLVSHQFTDDLEVKFHRIKQSFAAYGDVKLLLHWEEDNGQLELPNDIDCVKFTTDDLNTLHYEPIAETIVPGSNHFALLWFYLQHPEYRYYWNIEYDVEFTGDWKVLFDAYGECDADFIATHLKWYKEDVYWYWWNSYHGTTFEVPYAKRIRSFNPIYRISGAALSFLDGFLKAGNYGHHEVLIPIALYHHGYSIQDFGGKGNFVPQGHEERFYLSNDTTDVRFPYGTMLHKPSFENILEHFPPNKLVHPVKNSLFRNSGDIHNK